MPLLVALLLGGVCFILIAALVFNVACVISPTEHIDTLSGEKHVVMAIGQAMVAILLGSISALITFIFALKYFIRRSRAKINRPVNTNNFYKK